MTDIEQAARAQAEQEYALGDGVVHGPSYRAFVAGASWLAEYLLSDENVERAARAMYATDHNNDGYNFDDDADRGYWRSQARAALQAVLGKEAS